MAYEDDDTIQESGETINIEMNGISSMFKVLSLWILVMMIWAILGIIAFIMSIICFFKNSTVLLNILGLLMALFLGPFYFVYFMLVTPYCRSD